jgi:hypothetical protein
MRSAVDPAVVIPPLLDAWVGLSNFIAEISEILNTSAPLDVRAVGRLGELDMQLRHWYTNLPPEATYKDPDISSLNAEAYGLHMHFLRAQMLLYRTPIPGASRKRRLDVDHDVHVLQGWTLEQSNQVVHHNALRIAQFLSSYRRVFGTENIPSVMLDNIYVASTTLVSHIVQQLNTGQLTDEKDLHWLRFLLETMNVLEVHYPITSRMTHTLARLVHGSSLESFLKSEFPDLQKSQAGSSLHIADGLWGSFDPAISDLILDAELYNFEEPVQV